MHRDIILAVLAAIVGTVVLLIAVFLLIDAASRLGVVRTALIVMLLGGIIGGAVLAFELRYGGGGDE